VVVADKAVTADEEPPGHWWQLYDDPELNQLVTAALAANTDLRVAEANLERSHALVEQVKARQQVQGSFNADPAYALMSAEQYFQPQVIGAMGMYDLGASAFYELDLFGGIRRGIEAASAEHEAVAAARDQVQMAVAAQVVAAYVDLCSAGAQRKHVEQMLALQQERLEYLQTLAVDGRGTRLNITPAQEILERVRADIPTLDARTHDALYLLATLTGRPPAAMDVRLQSCTVIPVLDRPIPVGDGVALLKRRPDIRRAERELAAATAHIGVVTADLYPRITLGGGVGSTGRLSDFLDALTNRFAIGFSLHWELNPTATRARIEQAEAAARASLARFDGVVLKALRETASALDSYTQALERDATLRAARERSLAALTDMRTLEAAGRATRLQTLDAERALAALDNALIASQAQIAADQVAVFLALGGGWNAGAGD
jgi:NodT family efflux transporter outer membrane factor (OMF) lipoprotein